MKSATKKPGLLKGRTQLIKTGTMQQDTPSFGIAGTGLETPMPITMSPLVEQVEEKQPVPSSLRDGYECPIDLTLCAEPIKTPCGHYFCLQCAIKLLNSAHNSCPLCRTAFDTSFKPIIDRELQAEISKHDKSAFQDRKEELIDAGEWYGEDKGVAKVIFGNQYEKVNNPKNQKLCHRWCVFLSLNNQAPFTQKYIKHIVWQLPKTYKHSQIIVDQPPYLLSRTAYQSFVIGCEICFQEWTDLPVFKFEHMLSFKPGGLVFSGFFDVSVGEENSYEETSTVKGLVKELTKISESCQKSIIELPEPKFKDLLKGALIIHN